MYSEKSKIEKSEKLDLDLWNFTTVGNFREVGWEGGEGKDSHASGEEGDVDKAMN